LAVVPNVKINGYSEERREIFEYFGSFWHGCLSMPNRHKPIGNTGETLQNRFEEKLKRGCRKSTMPVIRLYRSGGASLENCCAINLALKTNFARTPM